uniref:Uncharacterized protein n=1 Tax=Cacopsylla melanoneura TaxID=428564 RepID=A0A8D9A5F3_9HEMI
MQRLKHIFNVHIRLPVQNRLHKRHHTLQVGVPRQIDHRHITGETRVQNIRAVVCTGSNTIQNDCSARINIRTFVTVVHSSKHVHAFFPQVTVDHFVDLADLIHAEVDAVEQDLDAFQILDKFLGD